ncbi:hypothetical protein JXI42_12630 [bacterium]|nr:hypothetical protein [bacterium]
MKIKAFYIFVFILLISSISFSKTKTVLNTNLVITTEEADSNKTKEAVEPAKSQNILRLQYFNTLKYNFKAKNYHKIADYTFMDDKGFTEILSLKNWIENRFDVYYRHDKLNRRYDPNWIEYRLFKYSDWDLFHHW